MGQRVNSSLTQGRVLNFLVRVNPTSLRFSLQWVYKFPECPTTLPQDMNAEKRFNKLILACL